MAKNLKVKILLSYKRALIDPLKYGFDNYITNEYIIKCLKGMSILSPGSCCRPPDWSMELVLQLILDNYDNNSLLFHTQKTLFLLGLCLGSRISELFSLMRGQGSLIKLPNGTYRIFEDPQFLAKNENQLNRRGPVSIRLLQDGSSALCPARALTKYLQQMRTPKDSSCIPNIWES